jgi:hypothetical protein
MNWKISFFDPNSTGCFCLKGHALLKVLYARFPFYANALIRSFLASQVCPYLAISLCYRLYILSSNGIALLDEYRAPSQHLSLLHPVMLQALRLLI